jgi:hypothetical protein
MVKPLARRDGMMRIFEVAFASRAIHEMAR